VYDGDTIGVLVDGYAKPIRLDGVDTPEAGQPWAKRAREYTAMLVLNKTVRVDPRDMDKKYDRLVARVTIEGRDISELLVADGLAWHYVRFSDDPVLAAAEAAARAAKRGLWIDAAPIAPWEWRARGRLSPHAPRTQSSPSEASGPLHGNVNSLVYHRPSCRNYWCARCSRLFATEEDARRAGFRPASCCH
jgi:hypothetical protein